MLIDFFSDLHIDSWAKTRSVSQCRETFRAGLRKNEGSDLVVFAGDAGNSPEFIEMVEGVLNEFYDHVFVIMGNHDYYNAEHFTSQRVMEVGGKKILGATLWTNFRNNPSFGSYAEQVIHDYAAIDKWTAFSTATQFQRDRKFLVDKSRELRNSADLVVTHFPPVLQAVHPDYAGDPANPYFVNDDPGLVNELQAPVWIFGHVHHKMTFTAFGTDFYCNPVGYRGENSAVPLFIPLQIQI